MKIISLKNVAELVVLYGFLALTTCSVFRSVFYGDISEASSGKIPYLWLFLSFFTMMVVVLLQNAGIRRNFGIKMRFRTYLLQALFIIESFGLLFIDVDEAHLFLTLWFTTIVFVTSYANFSTDEEFGYLYVIDAISEKLESSNQT